MKLALRSTAATNNWWLRFCAWLTRARLCSQWCHGAIVIDGLLYQANTARGLHCTADWNPAHWTLIDIGKCHEKRALAIFEARDGAPYDWLGVLGFALPVRGDRRALYCFEWCAIAIGAPPARWQTPERLLSYILMKEKRPCRSCCTC